MKIEVSRKFIENEPDHRLDGELSIEQIEAALSGLVKDLGWYEDADIEHQWAFTADGQECAIWEHAGLRWSASGPRAVFDKLGLQVID